MSPLVVESDADYLPSYPIRVCAAEAAYAPWDKHPLAEVYLRQARDFLPTDAYQQATNRNQGEDQVMLLAPFPEAPSKIKDIYIFHELSHGVYEDILNHLHEQNWADRKGLAPRFPINPSYVEAARRLHQAWRGIHKIDESAISPRDTDEEANLAVLKSNPAAAVLTENLYVRQKGRPIGHPWLSNQESFASVMTVLHFFPEQFMRHYGLLNNSDQRIVADIVHAAVGVLHAANPLADIHSLIPKIDQIQQRLTEGN
jgi:hypothetical protein